MKISSFVGKSAYSFIALFCASSLYAQSLAPQSETGDWVLYVDQDNSQHCYIVTTPKSSEAFRDGNKVDADRGTIRLYVGIKNGAIEPSFMAGYPLSQETNPVMEIGDKVFNFFINSQVDQQFAWPDSKLDAEIIASMRAGIEAKMTGISTRGTKTVDIFSLQGFTAAYNAALERCK